MEIISIDIELMGLILKLKQQTLSQTSNLKAILIIIYKNINVVFSIRNSFY